MIAHKIAILSRIALFEGLTPAEIRLLAERAIERHFEAGSTLFHEGDECAGAFIIGQGQVKICKTSPSGREMTIAVETAPSTVAELPLFDGGPYPASVVAIGDVMALVLEKREFLGVCRQHPGVALKMLAQVGRRLRQLVGTLEAVTFGSVRQRLARLLLELADPAGGSFALPLTHQDLASRLGTVREVVSRNLSRFQMEGLIRIEARQIRVADRAGLQREADTEM
ncbi:MAG: Crp/Fnr family transcriptional regulator [Acidobacteria bacterium]|nr:Crp/Fnr family transcriptional regulator [Acidobacteriota bacterium]